MAGTKVSQLPFANDPSANDITYIVNSGNSRQISLGELTNYLLTNSNVVTSVNGIIASNNAITVTKADVGLGNVPNVIPVTSLNTLTGNASIVGTTSQINISVSNEDIIMSIDPSYTLDFSHITGDWTSQSGLVSALSTIGLQTPPREININTSLALESSDISALWVDCNFENNTSVVLTPLNIAVGALIELRQAGNGIITVVPGLGASNTYPLINIPVGAFGFTNGIGTRIQISSLGGNTWEFI